MFSGIEAAFFDFDGVLVDSVDVKTQGFAALYRAEGPEIEKAVVRYHLDHGGISRYEKIRHFEEVLLGRPLDAARLAAIAQRFADLVVEAVVESPEVPGAEALLQRLATRGTPCHVVSGTPEGELSAIVARRGLGRYFKSVHGAPHHKADILKSVMAEQGYAPAACLMVGDALTDYQAASVAAVRFLGIVRPGLASPFPAGTRVAPDLVGALGLERDRSVEGRQA